MSPDHAPLPYQDIVAIAERLFDACEDDVRCISRMIETLDPASRNELLVSDLLNAFQVFFYFFRTMPDELTQERLELEPASSLVHGIKLDEIDLLELIFSVQDKKPVIVISDGEHPLVTYEGKSAYADGMKYIENPPY
ncbi:MAG: hypothetical protein LUQ37_06955 [Methanoregulaceae archaeon]|nr:hypothetical protein [Methanoregulaceae archaeon]